MSLPHEMYESGKYLAHNPTWDVADSPWKADGVRKILEDGELQPSSICEVGCGAGGVIARLRSDFPEAELSGFEIAPDAVQFWAEQEAARVRFERADFLTQDDGHYDVLLLLDVVEHIVDPFDFLQRILPRASHFVFHFPLDLSAQTVLRELPLLQQRRSVGHLHYFTKGLALELLRECGYRVLRWSYTGAGLSGPRRNLKARLSRLPRRLAYWINKDLGVRLLGGETLMILAEPSA